MSIKAFRIQHLELENSFTALQVHLRFSFKPRTSCSVHHSTSSNINHSRYHASPVTAFRVQHLKSHSISSPTLQPLQRFKSSISSHITASSRLPSAHVELVNLLCSALHQQSRQLHHVSRNTEPLDFIHTTQQPSDHTYFPTSAAFYLAAVPSPAISSSSHVSGPEPHQQLGAIKVS